MTTESVHGECNASFLSPAWVSGEMICFRNGQHSFVFIIERVTDKALLDFAAVEFGKSAIIITIALPSTPYSRLRISNPDTGTLDWHGNGSDKCACWAVLSPSSCTTEVHACFRNFRAKGAPRCRHALSADSCSLRTFKYDCTSLEASRQPVQWTATPVSPHPPPCPPPFCPEASCVEVATGFTQKELTSFVHKGFLVAPGLVPPSVLEGAQVAVLSRLGRPGGFVDFLSSEEEPVLRPPSGHRDYTTPLPPLPGGEDVCSGRLCAEASYDPVLLQPARCPEVLRLVRQLLGEGVAAVNGVQVALRFPGSTAHDALVVSGAAMKSTVDGSSWHTDGLRQGKKHSFSLLVGVALSDMCHPDTGNLCVWPRSHLHIHHWMRHPDGKMARPKVSSPVGAARDSAEKEGDGTVDIGYSDCDGPLPDMGPPLQLLLRPGDVVFMHSETGHCGGPHLGPGIRIMLYYRIRHADWREMCAGGTLVDDMWCDLPGVAGLPDAQVLKKGCLHPPDIRHCSHIGDEKRHHCM